MSRVTGPGAYLLWSRRSEFIIQGYHVPWGLYSFIGWDPPFRGNSQDFAAWGGPKLAIEGICSGGQMWRLLIAPWAHTIRRRNLKILLYQSVVVGSFGRESSRSVWRGAVRKAKNVLAATVLEDVHWSQRYLCKKKSENVERCLTSTHIGEQLYEPASLIWLSESWCSTSGLLH